MITRDLGEIKNLRAQKMGCIISSSLENRIGDYVVNTKIEDKNFKIKTSSFPFFIPKKIQKRQKLDGNIGYYSKQDLDRFSPDKINSELFWNYMFKNFPLASITSKEVQDIEEANLTTLNFAIELKAVGALMNSIESIDYKEPRILEIGGGHGNLYYYLSDNNLLNVDKNYYNVDLLKNFKHKNFYKTNGYGLPKELINKKVKFDTAYSINVFQHLSYRQRISYYYSVYEKLKDGGNFIVGLLLENDNNQHEEYWGNKDLNGNNYCRFFNQFTPIDKQEVLFHDLFEIGFKKINIVGFSQNYYVLSLVK